MYSEETINQAIQPKSLALTVTIAIAWRFVIIFWAKTILSWINTVIINNMVLVLDFSLWLIHVVLLDVWDCLDKLFPSLSFFLSLSFSFSFLQSILCELWWYGTTVLLSLMFWNAVITKPINICIWKKDRYDTVIVLHTCKSLLYYSSN